MGLVHAMQSNGPLHQVEVWVQKLEGSKQQIPMQNKTWTK
jgi:hypothetical protein